jgi:hydrogenase maturation protease
MVDSLIQKACAQGKATRAPVVVVGIGNILLRDEGVGVRVVEHLASSELPDFVELVDGGTAGADLIEVFADRRLVVVVDTVSGDDPPGTVLRLTPQDLLAGDGATLSLHEVGVLETLEMTALLGCSPEKVVIFGVKPRQLSWGLGLSPEIEALVPRLAKLVVATTKGDLFESTQDSIVPTNGVP